MATAEDIKIFRGWTYVLLLPQFESNGTTPRDVTGSAWEFTIRSGGADVASPSVTIVDAATGNLSCKIAHTVTATLPAVGTAARFALTETLPNGDRIVRAFGRAVFADPLA